MHCKKKNRIEYKVVTCNIFGFTVAKAADAFELATENRKGYKLRVEEYKTLFVFSLFFLLIFKLAIERLYSFTLKYFSSVTYKLSPIPIASDATNTEQSSSASLNLLACSTLVAAIKATVT